MQSIRETLEAAYDDVSEVTEMEANEQPRDEVGKFAKEEPVDPPEAPVETPEIPEAVAEPTPVIEPPVSYTKEMKEKWNTLPPEVQDYLSKREQDVHKMATSHDSERLLGKELKDVITPYMPIITAEGGNPATAVQQLLNTAYLLRTGTPEQKAGLVRQIAQQYGVDLGAITQPQQQLDPALSAVQQELAQLKQFFTSQQQQQTQSEQQRIQSEIQAFAADPKNAYFEQVKSLMAPLLASGQAKDLQEAYDMACHASPSIRSTLLASQEADRKAKQKAEVEAKKKAAVSVTGSPGVHGPNTPAPKRSVREELEASFDAAFGSKI